MLKQNVRTRFLRPLPDPAADAPRTPPSSAAQARLGHALRDRAEAYRTDATVDLMLVEALLRMNELEAAARTLDEHRACLQSMARDLQVVVADAAVEREEERVSETCAGPVPGTSGTRTWLRRRAVAFAGAATLAVALLLPVHRISPRLSLVSSEARATQDEISAARQRLVQARSTAAGVRAQLASDTHAEALAVRAATQVPRAPDAGDPPAPITVLDDARALREHRVADGRRPALPDAERDADVIPLHGDGGEPGSGQRVDEVALAPEVADGDEGPDVPTGPVPRLP